MFHLIISTETHPDYIIARLTGRMPSSAVAVVDTTKKDIHLWVDSRYIGWERTPRSGWTYTISHRPPGRGFLDMSQHYAVSGSVAYDTIQELKELGLRMAIDTSQWFAKQRAIKSDTESKTMKTCYKKSLQVLAFIQQQIDDGSILGKSCLSLRGECIAYAMSLGLTGEAFSMIIATGSQTASPHHETDQTVIDSGPLLIDMGWKRKGWCSDLTRSWWIGEPIGKDYDERKLIYDSVDGAKYCCEQQATPGMTGTQIDAIARAYIENKGYGKYFTHSTGHGIGLEVHELPWITATQRGNQPVLPHMMLTIEPGIYLPGKFGVRIEYSYTMTDSVITILN